MRDAPPMAREAPELKLDPPRAEVPWAEAPAPAEKPRPPRPKNNTKTNGAAAASKHLHAGAGGQVVDRTDHPIS